MKPVIISYDCVDHDPIDEWVPEDLHDFDFWMNFTIGPDFIGGDNFLVRIVSPSNLNGQMIAKHSIVLIQYSLESVLVEVEKFLSGAEGENWMDVSGMLSKSMQWEYADYKV